MAAANRPGVELVTRDRSSVYANAITIACPSAVQVADRWHLLANLSEAVERFPDTQRTNINQSMSATLLKEEKPMITQQLTEDKLPPFITWETDISQLMSTAKFDCTSKGYVTFQKVKQLQAEGHGMRAIARHLGVAASAVRQKHRQALLEAGYIRSANGHEAVKLISVRGLSSSTMARGANLCKRPTDRDQILRL